MRDRADRPGELDSLLSEMKRSDVAAEITQASKSNLAFAFIAMSGARRRDITTFYAFCRVIDDIADDNRRDRETKRRELRVWRESLRGVLADEPALARPVRQLMSSYPITPEMLEEIITGVEMDVDIRRYATWNELRIYCHRVASAVGLVSIEIFGYKNPRCRDYAIALGLALQITNIIRDVEKDLKVDRIYLPAEDLARFTYTEKDLRNAVTDARFIQLMNFEAARAENFFAEARKLLPPEDKRAMLPAEIMRSIYQSLLGRMEVDHFKVFEKDYRLSKLEKVGQVTAQFLNCFLSLPRQASD
jgi:phytoene synthase